MTKPPLLLEILISVSGSKPSKVVQTHRDWTIGWNSTSAAILCAFFHHAFELQQCPFLLTHHLDKTIPEKSSILNSPKLDISNTLKPVTYFHILLLTSRQSYEYVTCHRHHLTFPLILTISDQNCVQLTFLWFNCTWLLHHHLIAKSLKAMRHHQEFIIN
jgi:hypothetical protein